LIQLKIKKTIYRKIAEVNKRYKRETNEPTPIIWVGSFILLHYLSTGFNINAMLYVVIVTYQKSIEEVDNHLAAHRDFLERYYSSGQFIASGPQTPRTGGILLSKGHSKQEILDILKDDPFNILGIASYEVIEFNPVKYHKTFKQFID